MLSIRPDWSGPILLKPVVRLLFFCAVLSALQGVHASSTKLSDKDVQAV